jgi:hypothetical protein
MTTSVRHCMEYRYQQFDPSLTIKPPQLQSKVPMKDPIETILELTYLMNISNENEVEENIESLLSSFIKNPESVLQEIDIQRLRAIIYRDVVRQDRSKTGKNIVVVVVNLINIFSFFALCVLRCILFVFLIK